MNNVFKAMMLVVALIAQPITMSHARAPLSPDATTIHVTTTNDELNSDGDCSLREAIQASNQDKAVSGCPAGNGSDIIRIPAGVYTLNLSNADALTIYDSSTLIGESAATTIIDGNANGKRVLRSVYQEMLVCDSSDHTIKRFSTKGTYAGTYVKAASNGGLSYPNTAKLNYDGALYVSGFGSGIKRYRANTGVYSDTLIATSGAFGTYNTLAPTDFEFKGSDIFVADYYPPSSPSSPGRILRFNRDTGAFVSEFVAPGSGGLKNPNSIAFSGSYLYVTDASSHNVLRYNATTGAFVSTFVSAGSGGLNRPRDLIFWGDRLLVASEETDQVLRYDASTGAFEGVFVSAGSGGLDKPQSMTFGPDGNLYVSSNATKQILRYNGDTGAFIDVFVDDGEGGAGTVGCPVFVGGLGFEPIVNLHHLTIQNGVESGSGAGGGIINYGSYVQMYRSVVKNNKSRDPGAGISNSGTFVLTESTISANQTITGTTGGTQYSGGGIVNYAESTLKIYRSTISDNIAVRGGGIRNFGGKLEITDSTISGNRAQARGGGLMNYGTAWIAYTTITNNEANINWPGGGSEEQVGGGIANYGHIDIGNSIVAGNKDNYTKFDAEYGPDCWSVMPDDYNLTSFRGNLIGILSAKCPLKDTIWGNTAFDQVGTPDAPLNARLNPLANNGGPTQTHKPQSNSPAIDQGDGVTSATFFDCNSKDQRGANRPFDGNEDSTSKCDVGAVEYGSPVVKVFVPIVVKLTD
jgi:CSLREA domain-containing protein